MVGLLLLLGLFWYWASTLIGDDSDSPSTPTAQAVIINETPAPTATATQASEAQNTAAAGQPTTAPTEAPADTPTKAATQEEEPTAVSTKFAKGDTVVTTSSVRMRESPDATDDSNVIANLDEDTTLTITGPAEMGPGPDGDDIVWWPVTSDATGDGYVAEEYLDAS